MSYRGYRFLHHCIMALPIVEHLCLFLFLLWGLYLSEGSPLPYCSSSSTSSWFLWFCVKKFFICSCNMALSASNRVILSLCSFSYFFVSLFTSLVNFSVKALHISFSQYNFLAPQISPLYFLLTYSCVL